MSFNDAARMVQEAWKRSVSKPQIPSQVDWFVSSCNKISSCGSATQNTPRTTSIDDAPTNQ
jgi:hypothetical protein